MKSSGIKAAKPQASAPAIKKPPSQPVVTKPTTSTEESVRSSASRVNSDKALGLSPLPKKVEDRVKSEPTTKSAPKSDDQRTLLTGDTEKFRTLADAEDQLKQIEDGQHPELNAELEAIEKAHDKDIDGLNAGREKAEQHLEDRTQQARERLERAEHDHETNFRDDRDKVREHRQAQDQNFDNVKAIDEKAASLVASITHDEWKLEYDKDLTTEQKERMERQIAKEKARLKDRHGVTLPTPQEMERYEKEGLPSDGSLASEIHGYAFNRRKKNEIREAIPKTQADRDAFISEAREHAKETLKEIEQKRRGIPREFESRKAEYAERADRAKRHATSQRVRDLTETVRENQTFKKSELPDYVQNSVAAAGIEPGAEAQLVNGQLVFTNKDGTKTTLQAQDGYLRTSDDSKDVQRSGYLYPDGKESIFERRTQKNGLPEDTKIELDGKGRESREVTQHHDPGYFKDTTIRENGREVSTRKDVKTGNHVFTPIESKTTYEEDGTSETIISERYDGENLRRNTIERKNPDGELVARTQVGVQTLENGERTTTKVLLDPKTGISRTTVHLVERKDGQTVETTEVLEDTDYGGLARKSKVVSTISDPRNATDDELDFPGLGWAPWDNPQDLINEMESSGGRVQVQSQERQITENGRTRTETSTRYFNRDNEITLTQGQDGKNIWTKKKTDPETGLWRSQTFFQGSDDDNILTEQTKEGRYLVETTRLRMKDHPGAERSEVPLEGDYVTKRAEKVDMKEIERAAESMGIEPDDLKNMEAMKTFLEKVGAGKTFDIELKTSSDKFADSRLNKDGSSMIITGPNGEKFVLARDNKNDIAASRVEYQDQNKELVTQQSLLARGIHLEEISAVDQTRTRAKQGEVLFKSGNKVFRAAGRAASTTDSSKRLFDYDLAKQIGPGLDLISGSLSAISAAQDFSKGNYARALATSGGAASDFGMMVRATQELRKTAENFKFGGGAAGLVKKIGVGGAAFGLVSGAFKIADGDHVGGGLDAASSLLTGLAIWGVPGVGWAAGLFTLGSAAWDYRNGTVIATPEV